jgi:transcription elongation factor Elf1
MSKAHRGKGIRELAAHGRGTCPVCGATGIKILYEAGEQKVKVCKPCKAAVKHGKKSISEPVPAAAE